MSNTDAAASGDQLLALRTLRDTLARELDTTDSNTHAQLAAQYRLVLAEIAELSGVEGESDAERIAADIADGIANPNVSDAAGG